MQLAALSGIIHPVRSVSTHFPTPRGGSFHLCPSKGQQVIPMKRSARFAFIATLFCAISAHAITYDVTIAFDTDRKTSTGCTFTSPAGTFAGVEQLVTTHVSVTGG